MAGKNTYPTVNEMLKPKQKKGPKPSKVRTTFYLDAVTYQKFQDLCKDRETSPSAIVEAFMADVLKENK